jgi:hypothetical protein
LSKGSVVREKSRATDQLLIAADLAIRDRRHCAKRRRDLSWTVPSPAATQDSLGSADKRDRERSMSLQAMALTGLVAAVVLIVITITLINKFAN